MKEKKLFEIVNNIDDDLICEMLDYSPDVKEKGGEYEGVLYRAPEKVKKAHYWQYPVTAAALMLALVGALFIFNANNNLPYNDGDDRGNPPADTSDNTAGEITTTDDPYTPVDTNIPYEFTQEDKELQKFLAETVGEALKYQGLFNYGSFGDIGHAAEGDKEHERIITARFPQMEEELDKQISYHYTLLSDELPFKTREELEAGLKQYFSAEVVSQFMDFVVVGEITERTEEYCQIEITEGGYFDDNGFLLGLQNFIELDGRLYRVDAYKGGGFTPNWSMAKVLSRTDDQLIFSYLGYGMDDIKEIRAGLGWLKYEDGWKYDWWDISSPYEMVDFEAVWGTGSDAEGTGGSTQMTHIVPDKAVTLGYGQLAHYVLYTDQYPEFDMPDISNAEFTEMSTVELFEYYGLYGIPYRMEQGEFTEVTDENTSHGIYTFPDGSLYDINTFTFSVKDDEWFHIGKKFTVTVGRNSRFGQEYDQEPDYHTGSTYYYDEERETFFFVMEKFGSCVMVSGKVDELSDYDDELLKESFYEKNSGNDDYWQGVPREFILVQGAVSDTLMERELLDGNE